MKLRKISKCLLCILTLSICMMSGKPAIYASDRTGTESSGQSLYNALSKIYGEKSESSTGNSASGSSTGSSGDETEKLMQEMETEIKGPKVDESGISEEYHDNYKVYEERINDDISVFTNISNGSVVNHAVVIEFPEGVIARMKKDGKELDIVSDEPITEAGSYVVTFYVMEEDQDDIPFSQQTISKAKFRFRIQYTKGVAGYEAVDDKNPELSEKEVPDFSGLSYNPDGSVSGNISGSISNNRTVSDSDVYSDDSLLFGDEDNNLLPEDMRPDDYEYDMSELTEDEDKETESTETDDSFLDENGVCGEYDPDSGFYKNVTALDETFFTNVPNGMLTNDPVMLQPADDLIYIVYRNGEIYEDFTAGQYIRDEGTYIVEVKGSENEKAAIFRFRIINGPVSNMNIVNAPEKTSFRTVRYEGEDVSDSALINNECIRLLKDGNYEITMDTPGGSQELKVSLDTVQPIFNVALQPNLATITYSSDDIAYCTLYRDGKLVSDSEIVNEIRESGEYTLTAYDNAGNKSEANFKVTYRVNSAAVISILLVLALIGGIIYYLLKIKKKFKVI